jgi:hypothetical protein
MIMNQLIRLENPMPIQVSTRMREISLGASAGASNKEWAAGLIRSSSASSEDCQKKH